MRLQVRMGRERAGESVPYGLWATYERLAAVNTDSLAADEAAARMRVLFQSRARYCCRLRLSCRDDGLSDHNPSGRFTYRENA